MSGSESLSWEKFSNIFFNLSGYYWVVNSSFHLLAISESYLALLNKSKSSIISQKVFTAYDEALSKQLFGKHDQLHKILSEVIKSGQTYNFSEIKVINQSQKAETGFKIIFKPVLNNKQEVEYVIHQLEEVDYAIHRKTSVTNLEDGFKAAVKNSLFIPAQIDRELRYQWIYNPHPDFNSSSVIGKRDDELDQSEGAKELLDFKRQVLESETGNKKEIKFKRSDGERYYDFVLEPLRDSEGKVIGLSSVAFDITERKLAELSSQINELQYRAFFENTGVGAAQINPQFEFIRVNDRFCQMTAYSREELLSMTPFDLDHPEDKTKDEKNLINLFAKGNDVYRVEKRYIRKDGAVIWVHVTVSLIKDTEGKPICTTAIIEDISGRKEAERKEKENGEKYHSLFTSIDEAFTLCQIIVDQEGKPIDYQILEANPAFEKLTGISCEEALSKTARELVPDIEDWWIETYGKVALQEEPVRLENKVGPMNQWFSVYAFPRGGGKFAAIFTDITERKLMEESLRDSEERRRLAVEAAGVADWYYYPEEESFQFSEHAKRLFALSDSVAYPLDYIIKRIHPFDREKVSASLKAALDPCGDGGFDIDFRLMRQDNQYYYFEARGATDFVKTSGKVIPQVLRGAIIDITERKQIEVELKLAKEEAEKAARAKEEFLAHMSHEIRTPLNAVVGIANLLNQQDALPSQEKNIEALKFASENLMSLVNDILDFSKIKSGKVKLNKQHINLKQFLSGLEQTYYQRAEEYGNTLSFQLDDNIPQQIYADKLKLSQVLHNLIGNALKFTRGGKVVVEVHLHKRKDRQLWLYFSITDTGSGIPADQLKSIFDEFSQVNKGNHVQEGGTGLGLAITKLLLELMGSDIQVESKEGEGSKFFFVLPTKQGKVEHNFNDINKAEATTTPDFSEILLVEDVAINRMVIKQFLQDWWDLKPDEASNGKEALEMVRQNKYDLILMDVRMPVMDGYEATQHIRNLSQPAKQAIPIIAITADTVEQFQKHTHAGLFTDVVTKPFDPDQLREAISASIANRKVTRKSSGKEAIDSNEQTYQYPNFSKAEEPFEDSKNQKKKFYKMALNSLNTFKKEFFTAFERSEIEKLKDLMHKERLLLNMFELDGFYHLMYDARQQLEKEIPPNELQAEQERISQYLEEIINRVKKRSDELR
ncbi:PAS domain S-box protein [Catalinimonas sp. 4WD22]|uniref:PAS domain S-box protein n=1 Tax=Catalinimonas locisalis TaxID=3133978 RepID=UPI003100F42D